MKINLIATFFTIILNFFAFFLLPLFYFLFNLLPVFDLFRNLTIFYMGLYKSFYTCQFCIAGILVHERFELLNESLKHLWMRRKLKLFTNSGISTALQHVSKLYLDLCDLIELVNSTFSVHLIFTFFTILVSSHSSKYAMDRKVNNFLKLLTIFACFGIVQTALKTASVPLVAIALHGNMVIFQYLTMILLAVTGTATTKQAENTMNILEKLMNTAEESEASDLAKFLIQIRTRDLKLRNIFFSIDWNVVLAVSS